MSNQNYSANPSRSVNKAGKGGGKYATGNSASPKFTVKQAFTSVGLPGKAADGFAKAKKGYREVNGYAAWKGLSQSNSKPPQLRQGSVKDVQNAVLDDAAKAESQYPIVQSMGKMDVRTNMYTNGGNFQKAMKKAGYGK